MGPAAGVSAVVLFGGRRSPSLGGGPCPLGPELMGIFSVGSPLHCVGVVRWRSGCRGSSYAGELLGKLEDKEEAGAGRAFRPHCGADT